MQHPIDPAIDFNSIRDAIESMLVGRDQLVDDRDMQNILIAILEYSRQQRAVCQNPYINNATNTWYVYDSNGNPYDTNVSAEGTIIRQTEAQSIEGDPRVTLAQIDPMKPNEMKMTIYIPKGERGESGSVVTIVDGYWYIDGVNTGVVATGEAPTISEDGYWVVGGEKTEFKAVGTDGRDGVDGRNGADGYSPTATVVKTGNTATIEITDKNGTTTATISDGINGTDGQDGEDGFSPEVEVIQGDNSATINITDKTGQHSATISGLDGSYVPLYSTEKDWENRANWGNHYRVLMYGKQGLLPCYDAKITPIYMCPKYDPMKLTIYNGSIRGQVFKKENNEYKSENVTLLCSFYSQCPNVHSIKTISMEDIAKVNGYYTLSDYINKYNTVDKDKENFIQKIKYWGSDNIENYYVLGRGNTTIIDSSDGDGTYTYGKPLTTEFALDNNGSVIDGVHGHLFPLRAYKSYSINVSLNATYEHLFQESNRATSIIAYKTYIVKGEEGSYVEYNSVRYYPEEMFTGINNIETYTSNNAYPYSIYKNPLDNERIDNGDCMTISYKPFKCVDKQIFFSTNANGKVTNFFFTQNGDIMYGDERYDKEFDWDYGTWNISIVNGDLFFYFDNDISTTSGDEGDFANFGANDEIYGNWNDVDNINYGDTTKDILNCTLLLDVVENDLTQVTTNNDSPAIEQS